MNKLSTRLFVWVLVVALGALALGTWWVRLTVQQELGRQVEVEQTIERRDGQDIIRETRRETGPDGQVISETVQGVDVESLTRRLLIALAVIVIGAALVTTVVARRVLGPLQTLTRAAGELAAGQSTTRVPERGRDEIAAVARAFNTMADALARQEQLKRDLTNDIAHELRTPLTDLRCHLEALQDDVVPLTPESVATLHAEVVHLQRLVEDLGELARAEARQLSLSPERLAVGPAVDHLCRQASPRAEALGVSVEAQPIPDGLAVWVDPARWRQIVGNLLDNALVHTPAGGRVRIAAVAEGDAVAVSVSDTGPGIAADHVPHVFDRFYRVDPSRTRSTGGVGLGLAIARQLTEASGGRITVASTPGQGTTFTVTLPGAPS